MWPKFINVHFYYIFKIFTDYETSMQNKLVFFFCLIDGDKLV